ncbi:hypothetical protein [Streptomyces specialis]|uniref:hypothetical protein n=1 Tax=Streptomyces specialis TaxID=498367 RepID=UPI00073E5B84|nr:hypothetical protein [Streptomyces specialis]
MTTSPRQHVQALTAQQATAFRSVTAIMAAVVCLTFLFGFGNVWSLALRLGVPPWVAPLVAPAVDLSVLGLLLAIRYLTLYGATSQQLRPARRLLVFSSTMTLALNIADPLVCGHYGKAAFDAVGPLLLIGWAEVGPGLLQTISSVQLTEHAATDPPQTADCGNPVPPPTDDLLERARHADARHRLHHQRPISAESLRKELHIGSARSRMLVSMLRGNDDGQAAA